MKTSSVIGTKTTNEFGKSQTVKPLYAKYMKYLYCKHQPDRTDAETIELAAIGLRFALSETGKKREATIRDIIFRLEGGYDNFRNGTPTPLRKAA